LRGRLHAAAPCCGYRGTAPAEYDRIHLNNVPEYNGVLAVLTELVPRLKPRSDAWLTHNVMLASTLYEDAAHYLYASTLLPPDAAVAVGALLGVHSPWATIWLEDVTWRRGSGCGEDACSHSVRFPGGAATPAALGAWLRGLAAAIVLPQAQRGRPALHQSPEGLPVFLRLIEALAARGVPPHWLGAALQLLLGSDAARAAVPVPEVPRTCNMAAAPGPGWPIATARLSAWDLGLAGAELDALTALWAPRLPVAMVAPAIAAATAAGVGGAPVLLELAFNPPDADHLMMCMLKPQSCAMGVLCLHPAELARRESAMDLRVWARDFPAQRGTSGVGGARAQLVSAARWVGRRARWEQRAAVPAGEDGKLRMQFWLCEGRLESMVRSGWVAHVVSTDTWAVWTVVPTPLASAQIVRRAGDADKRKGGRPGSEGLDP
jgi:hypothetical protein